jgi:hypothetical protein
VHIQITNGGKTNQAGKLQYSAYAPHVNPEEDPGGWLGFYFMQRFMIDNEQPPDHRNWEDYAYKPVFRSMSDPEKALSDSTMYEHWKTFFSAIGICTPHVVHQPRLDGQQRLDEYNVPQNHIARFAKYGHGGNTADRNVAQEESYLTTPPLDCLVAMAGDPSRHHNARRFYPGWNDVKTSLPELVYKALPQLHEQIVEVCDAFDKATSHQQREKERLYMARGSLLHLRSCIERAFQIAAARPIDADTGKVKESSQPLFYTYRNSPLFHHPIWQSDEFKALVVSMEARQDELSSQQLRLTIPITNAFEELVNENLVPPIEQIVRGQDAITNAMVQGFSEMRSILDAYLVSRSCNQCHCAGLPSHGSDASTVDHHSLFFLTDSHTQPPSSLVIEDVRPDQDVTKDGRPRKRRRMIRQEDQQRMGSPEGRDLSKVPEEHHKYYAISLANTSAYSADRLWSLYSEGNGHLPPLMEAEEVTSGKWRSRWKCQNGREMKATANWFTARIPFFNYMHHKIDVESKSLMDALAEAEVVWSSIPTCRRNANKRPIKKVMKAFRSAIKEENMDPKLLCYQK